MRHSVRMEENAELSRLLENICRFGSIAAVDTATARCRVESGGLTTTWLPWLALRAGADRTWWAPTVGEQVMLLCPGGNPSNGLVLMGVYSDNNPAPGNTDSLTIFAALRDGTKLSYDHATHHLIADVSGDVSLICDGDLVATIGGDAQMSVTGDLTATAATATLTAADITLNGNVAINGNVSLTGNMAQTGSVTLTGNNTTTGNINVTGAVSANGVGLASHTHISSLPGTPTATGVG